MGSAFKPTSLQISLGAGVGADVVVVVVVVVVLPGVVDVVCKYRKGEMMYYFSKGHIQRIIIYYTSRKQI